MFVVFEGIDGSGKTTISNRVATALAAEGLTVKHLREGGKFVSPVSELHAHSAAFRRLFRTE